MGPRRMRLARTSLAKAKGAFDIDGGFGQAERQVGDQRDADLAQRHRAGQLSEQQGGELALGRKPAHPRVGAVFVRQFIEPRPRHMLQKPVRYAIGMGHGAWRWSLLVSKSPASI